MGVDKEAGLIHLETSVSDTQALYITCKLQNCSEGNKGKPFPGFIDPNSLVVQDEYVFVQVTTGGRTIYYVSSQRDVFTPMKLPKYTLPKDLHVISTDEKRVVAAVQEWNQNDTFNLYVSESGGVYYTLALENVMSSMGPEGNVMIDLYEVAGIKGMFLANKKQESQVKTYITYNKGRDWRLLQAPHVDLRGNSIHCMLPYCSLHLHLHVSANPYTSGNIASKESAPGIIMASGSIGAELSSSNVSMYITSDAGNTWRQIFDEEYSVLYLDQGGALVAIRHTPLPIRHLWLSFDEGRLWNKYSFTSSPLFVDGVLGEPGEETLIMTIFGHVSHRSEWQLVKIDFRSIFNRRCTDGDYQTWHLQNQGETCLMGVKRIYRKLKSVARCVMGKTHSVTVISEPCDCTESDFECDYGYERRSDGKCSPAFWFLPSSMWRSCTTVSSFLNSTGYRKVVSNNCTGGVVDLYTARRQPCPRQAPRGLHLVTSDGTLTATVNSNVTFMVFLEEGSGSRTSIMLDFGNGNTISYSNISTVEDGIRHVYRSVGIYRVAATARNDLGAETVLLYLHVTCPLEHIHLSAPFVAVKSKEVNLTAVLWPSQVGTVTYIWWLGNNSEPVITLDGSVAFTFSREGINVVTVQVSSGNIILQDRKTIAVHEYFKSHLLAFSSNLDEHNPDVAEWRLDVSRVIRNSMVQATGMDREQLLVTVLPGLPTTAEFFLLPDKQVTEGKPEKTTQHLDELSEMVLGALNQNLVQFTFRPGVQITVYAAHLSAVPLVDTSEKHSGSAMLMLLSGVVVGLAVFVIYKFKRKIPGLSIYAQMQNEKEQEMIQSPVGPAVDATVAVATAAVAPAAVTAAAILPVQPQQQKQKQPRPPRELVVTTSSLEPLDTAHKAHSIGGSKGPSSLLGCMAPINMLCGSGSSLHTILSPRHLTPHHQPPVWPQQEIRASRNTGISQGFDMPTSDKRQIVENHPGPPHSIPTPLYSTLPTPLYSTHPTLLYPPHSTLLYPSWPTPLYTHPGPLHFTLLFPPHSTLPTPLYSTHPTLLHPPRPTHRMKGNYLALVHFAWADSDSQAGVLRATPFSGNLCQSRSDTRVCGITSRLGR
ncbi:hypothetical protein ACEWY4_001551 [Coilia grayii]|uniref:PKD domain-containing protein n=1 Tax=Coilia grayii TaxID=363190 RepID=A0ABD1KTC9_9TELE